LTQTNAKKGLVEKKNTPYVLNFLKCKSLFRVVWSNAMLLDPNERDLQRRYFNCISTLSRQEKRFLDGSGRCFVTITKKTLYFLKYSNSTIK